MQLARTRAPVSLPRQIPRTHLTSHTTHQRTDLYIYAHFRGSCMATPTVGYRLSPLLLLLLPLLLLRLMLLLLPLISRELKHFAHLL